MAAVEIADAALADLNALIETHRLPADSWGRVAHELARLALFPRMGRQLSGDWRGYRAIAGPWRWMLLIHRYDAAADLVTVATVQDARSSVAATAE